MFLFRIRRSALVAAATLALGAGTLLSLAGLPSLKAAPAAQGNQSSCSDLDPETGLPISTRQLLPNSIRICETSTVSITVGVSCGSIPLHLMLSVDHSGSMIGQPWEDVKDASAALLDILIAEQNDQIMAGLVAHGAQASVRQKLTDRLASVKGKVNSISPGGEDNLPQSITKAKNELVGERKNSPITPLDIMVVLSDGGQTYPPQQAVSAAAGAKSQNILVIAVCIENGTAGGCQAMQKVASSRRYYFESNGTSGLRSIFRKIAQDIASGGTILRTLKVEEKLPPEVDYIPDSAVPEAEYSAKQHMLTWDLRFTPSTGQGLQYQIMPKALGVYTFALESNVEFRDSRDAIGHMVLPSAALTVPLRCDPPNIATDVVPNTPTNTPTNTPVPPTNTPTNTPTRTPTNTPTHTPTNTPTPVPVPIYLPILSLSKCIRQDIPLDIVLIIDASSSMDTATSSGRPRIDAAKEGARKFVSLMRPVDRVAVVAFNDAAWLAAPLSFDAAQLGAAIDGIRTAPYTRIDLALREASRALSGADARADAHKAVVLMTDGQPTRTTPAAVSAAGAAARALGTVFVIGVGGDIDTQLMIDVAGDHKRYYAADDAEALGNIYSQIAAKTLCGD